jgi:hypothetical protein
LKEPDKAKKIRYADVLGWQRQEESGRGRVVGYPVQGDPRGYPDLGPINALMHRMAIIDRNLASLVM